jgi:hypothetical protein
LMVGIEYDLTINNERSTAINIDIDAMQEWWLVND